MRSFIHLAERVSVSEIGGYADVVLDACCQNVASDDSLWHMVVEMSVLLVTLTQQSNPRSSWYGFFCIHFAYCFNVPYYTSPKRN